MDNIAQRLKAYIEHILSIPVTATAKLSWINCSKPIRSPMNPTRRKSVMASKIWQNY